MLFLLKLSVLHSIFLNLFVHTHAQDIFGAILGGVQDGINLVNNNLGVVHRDYPDYDQPASRDVSFTRSNELSQSNQNDSEEPYNSEQHQGDDSDWNSEEYDRGKPDFIDNKKIIPVHNHKTEQNRSPTRNPYRSKGNIKNKPKIRKPLLENKKPLPLEKERHESNNSVTENNDNFNNVTTINNNGSSTTSTPVVLPANSTAVDKKIPDIPVNDSTLNQNKLNSTQPVKNNTIEKNNTYVLKALTKKKFFFQAKPVVPFSEEASTNETIYYIDLD